MTELLKQAFDLASTLPEAMQDEIARMMLEMAQDDAAVIVLSPEERAYFDEADKEIARGDTISLDEALAHWDKLKL